jgi:pimeloyl-ACP methyl ester carboxylesterase
VLSRGLAVVVAGLLAGCLWAGSCQAGTTVVFVGGWGTTPAQLDALSGLVPAEQKAEFFLPGGFFNLIRPWFCADRLYDFVQRNLGDDDLIFVSFSLGGIVTQRMLNNHPELPVRKLILVASPVGGYRIPPPYPFFSDDFPKNLPVYVIAGSKSTGSLHLGEVNDGAVDVASAFAVPDDNLKGGVIFSAGHHELFALPQVQAQLAEWLSPDIALLSRQSETAIAHSEIGNKPPT